MDPTRPSELCGPSQMLPQRHPESWVHKGLSTGAKLHENEVLLSLHDCTQDLGRAWRTVDTAPLHTAAAPAAARHLGEDRDLRGPMSGPGSPGPCSCLQVQLGHAPGGTWWTVGH